MKAAKLYRSLKRCYSSAHLQGGNSFGIVLDIDGVLLRGRELLPRVKEAFKQITDEKGFQIPTVFLTNGTNCMPKEKAEKLSEKLGMKIATNQMIMAHGPLRMFEDLHKKNVLVVGQGNAKKIAEAVGFTKVTTIENLREWFPHLDCVDFARERVDPATTAKKRKAFQPIEAIILLSEPLKWETASQLIMDVLSSNGVMPGYKRTTIMAPQMPIIACNVDLVYMSDIELQAPRFGHGVFLGLLEFVYEKQTGRRLHYEAVLGKPAEISYLHAAHVIQRQANRLGLGPVKTLYVIGDNVMSDVLGSNLFDRYLQHGGRGRFDHLNLDMFDETDPPEVRTRHVVDRCISVLVETGVYDERCGLNLHGIGRPVSNLIEHLSHGEQSALKQPNFVEHDLYSAITQILNRERFRPHYRNSSN